MPAIKDWKTEADDREKYGLYLASREWGVLKEAVHKRAGGTCERCRKNPIGAVHHQTYVRKYQEQLDDLVGLCKDCHAFTHGKSDKDPAEKQCFLNHVLMLGSATAVEPKCVLPPQWFPHSSLDGVAECNWSLFESQAKGDELFNDGIGSLPNTLWTENERAIFKLKLITFDPEVQHGRGGFAYKQFDELMRFMEFPQVVFTISLGVFCELQSNAIAFARYAWMISRCERPRLVIHGVNNGNIHLSELVSMARIQDAAWLGAALPPTVSRLNRLEAFRALCVADGPQFIFLS